MRPVSKGRQAPTSLQHCWRSCGHVPAVQPSCCPCSQPWRWALHCWAPQARPAPSLKGTALLHRACRGTVRCQGWQRWSLACAPPQTPPYQRCSRAPTNAAAAAQLLAPLADACTYGCGAALPGPAQAPLTATAPSAAPVSVQMRCLCAWRPAGPFKELSVLFQWAHCRGNRSGAVCGVQAVRLRRTVGWCLRAVQHHAAQAVVQHCGPGGPAALTALLARAPLRWLRQALSLGPGAWTCQASTTAEAARSA